MRTIIIGSGLLGVATAYFLSKNGHEVTVLERGDEPACASSFANGGLLTPSMSEPWNAPGTLLKALKYLGKENSPLLFRLKELPRIACWGIKFLKHANPADFYHAIESNICLARYTLEVMASLRQIIPLDAYDGDTSGTLKVFRNNESLSNALAMAKMTKDFGVSYNALDVGALISKEPALNNVKDSFVGGIHYPDDEVGDARLFCKALAKEAEKEGVHFLYNCSVKELITREGKVSSVNSSEGHLTADNYVICAGVYSPAIAKTAGINLPIKPCKGYSITVPVESWHDQPAMAVVDNDLHTAVTPFKGRLRVAGTAEFNGYDLSINKARIDNLFNFLEMLYPESEPHFDKIKTAVWAGLRPVPADGKPFIGNTKCGNLYLNTGHFHLGWSMAAGSGQALADLIADKKPDIDLSAFGHQGR